MAVKAETMLQFLNENLRVPDLIDNVLKLETRLKNKDVLVQFININSNYDDALKEYAEKFYCAFRRPDPNPYFSVQPDFYKYLTAVRGFFTYKSNRHPLKNTIMSMISVVISSISTMQDSKAFHNHLVVETSSSFFRKFACVIVLDAFLQQSHAEKKRLALG